MATTDPRIHVISATSSFDGTTDFAGDWQPVKDPEQPRLNVSVATVGRFSFRDLVRSGVMAALVIARSLDSTASLTMTQRSASTAEIGELVIPDDPTPFVSNAAIATRSLNTGWSTPLLLDSTDALAFTGTRNTVVLMIFELGTGLAAATLLQAVLAASATASTITVVEINAAGTVPDFSGRTYFLVDISGGGVLTLPAVANIPSGAEAYFIDIGGDTVLVKAAGTEKLNDAAGGVVQLAGFGGTKIDRVSDGYVTTDPLILAPVTISNAVSGAVKDLPALEGQTISVELDFTADGDLLLPAASSSPKGFEYHLYRTIGASQIRLKGPVGGFINGLLNGVDYIPAAPGGNGGAAVIVKPGTNGWTVVGSNGLSPSPVTTVAVGNVVLAQWGMDEIIVRLTDGGAVQTATLPLISACPIGARARFLATGTNKTIAAAGANTLVGRGIAAAGTFTVPQNTAVVIVNSGLEWIVT